MAAELATQTSPATTDIIEFLEDVYETVELLKEKIAVLTVKYPVSARDNSLGEIMEQLQWKVNERLDFERVPVHTPTPPPTPSPPPASPDPIETPVHQVLYTVHLFDSTCLRRRTIHKVGQLEEVLPGRKKVKVLVNIDSLTNEKYDASKRSAKLKEARENCETIVIEIPNSSLHEIYVVDNGKLNLVNESIPCLAMNVCEMAKEKGVQRCFLHSRMATRLKGNDTTGRLETAIKIAAANYEYWSSVYYKSVANKETSSLQQCLRQYVKDPLHCKGVVYFLFVQDIMDERGDSGTQVFIGKVEELFIRELKENFKAKNTKSLSLFQLAIQDQSQWMNVTETESLGSGSRNGSANTVELEPKVIGIILDFGYPASIVDEFKGSLDLGDRLSTLTKHYIKYFGAKSPLGLNGGFE